MGSVQVILKLQHVPAEDFLAELVSSLQPETSVL